MGRKAKTGARKAKLAASKARGIEESTTEAHKEHQISSDAIRDEASLSQNEPSLAIRNDVPTDAGVACKVSHDGLVRSDVSQGYQPAALQQDKNSPLVAPQTGCLPKSNQAGAINDVVLQLLLEQQRATRQEEEHQFRLMQLLGRRMPNKQGTNDQVRDDTLRSAGSNQHTAALSALDGMQQQIMHGAPPSSRESTLLLQLLNQERLPMENVVTMGNLMHHDFHPSTARHGYSGQQLHHTPWLAPPPHPGGTSIIPRGFGFLTQPPPPHAVSYSKDQLRRLQALSLMPPLHQFVPHPSLSSMVHSIPSTNSSEAFPGTTSVGFGGIGAASAEGATTSYDLVPATPVNNELMQRAKQLVSLSQADMSTWRNTRRRFREEDDKFDDGDNHNGGVDHEDDEGDSKPSSRKRAKGSI